MATVDDKELYELSGDIVGGIGYYITQFSEMRREVGKALKACADLKEEDGKEIYVGKKKDGQKTYDLYYRVSVDFKGWNLYLKKIFDDFESLIGELKDFQKFANDSDYIALYCCIASINIICHKINSNFEEIDTFSIDTNLGGTNSFFYMTQIISKSLFLFMFENDGYSYNYYLYIPYCEDTTEEMIIMKSITLSLSNYFHFYTNDTIKINFYETNYDIEEYGYITINSIKAEINTLYNISEGDIISFVSNTTNSNGNFIIYYYLINSEGFYSINNCSMGISYFCEAR